jgi:hypothetical protein
VVSCPDAHQSATSVRTTRTFRPDVHQCLEASNSLRLHLSRRNGKSSELSSEFEKIPVFQCICPNYVVSCSGRATVQTIMFHRPDVALKQKRFLVKISKNSVALLSVLTAQVHRPDGIRTYYSSHPFCTSAYK